MYYLLERIFGVYLSNADLTLMHFAARAFLVFFVGVLLIRIQSNYVGISTSFTYLLNFALGSLLASAIVSQGAFFPILGVTFLLALTNWFIAYLCFRFPFIEHVFKGRGDILVREGRIIWDNMAKNFVTREKLSKAIFEETGETDLSLVHTAFFQSNGEILIVPTQKQPQAQK